MKKRPEQTKEQREIELRFIRKAPAKLRKHKKLINGNMTKEDLVMLLASLWGNLEKITMRTKENYKNRDGYHRTKTRKFRNIPPFNHFNKYPRKILVGIYGSTLQIARKEGLFN